MPYYTYVSDWKYFLSLSILHSLCINIFQTFFIIAIFYFINYIIRNQCLNFAGNVGWHNQWHNKPFCTGSLCPLPPQRFQKYPPGAASSVLSWQAGRYKNLVGSAMVVSFFHSLERKKTLNFS